MLKRMRTMLLVMLLVLMVKTVDARYGAIQAPGLSPRYYLGTSKEILERQSTGICAVDEHSCLDINGTGLLTTGLCCSNDKYCMIDDSFAPVCCEVGSNCGFPCASSQYQCKGTTSISGSASITASCCDRSCPSTSNFLCPSSLGGECCAYGLMCQSGGSCATMVTSSSGSGSSACPTAQTTCGSAVGGGCCSSGWGCTVISSTNYCAAGTQSAVRTGPNGILSTSSPSLSRSRLSTGAKAGIGGGIGGLSLLVMGGVLYFCVLQRRKAARQSDASSSVPATSQVSESKPRPVPGRRQTADYFGPAATAGPYTENFSQGSLVSPIHQRDGGVPLSPQSPGDIAVPVEIDSNGISYLKKTPTTVTEYPVELP